MTATLDQQLGAELDSLREARTYKRFLTLQSPQGPVVTMEGRGEVIVLSSNNYLGLAGHPEVVRAGIEGLERYGAGTASVRFICGTFEPHLALERALADLSGTEAALTYVSCWNANEACIPSLTDDTTVILTDELNHASLIDAIRLSRPASKVIYPHSDMDALRDGLAAAPREARKLIVTDGVFSMEGDVCDLPSIVELAKRFGARLMVDEAHGVGVLGARGAGACELFGLEGEVDLRMGTFSKSLASCGGFVAGSAEVIEYMRISSRAFIFSASAVPAAVGAALGALRIIRAEGPALFERLLDNAAYLRKGFRDLGLRVIEPGTLPDGTEATTPVVPVMVGEDWQAVLLWKALFDAGVYTNVAIHPAVPPGGALLRTSLMATHERDHLDRALEIFAEITARFPDLPRT